MRQTLIRKAAAVLVASASLVAMAAPASAGGNVIPLVCGNTTYEIAVNGNGAWTPGREVGSNRVFHPTWLGEFSGTFTPADGGDPFTFTDPEMTLPAAPQTVNKKATFTECTYTVDFTDDFGTFHGEGSASGWIS